MDLPRILSINILSRSALYSSYMPFITGGGLFIPSNDDYVLGSEVFLLLRLPDEADLIAATGVVVWITPRRAQGLRVAGFGIQFLNSEQHIKTRIESQLTRELPASRFTYTL